MHVFAIKLFVSVDLDAAVVFDAAGVELGLEPGEGQLAGLQIDDDRGALVVAQKEAGHTLSGAGVGGFGDEGFEFIPAAAEDDRDRRGAAPDERRPDDADGLVEQLKILNEALGLAVGGVGKNFKTRDLGVAPSLRRRQITRIGDRVSGQRDDRVVLGAGRILRESEGEARE